MFPQCPHLRNSKNSDIPRTDFFPEQMGELSLYSTWAWALFQEILTPYVILEPTSPVQLVRKLGQEP